MDYHNYYNSRIFIFIEKMYNFLRFVILCYCTVVIVSAESQLLDFSDISTSKPMAEIDEEQSSVLPVFIEEPKDTYVMRNKPATLSCTVKHAQKVYFKCNDDWIRTKHHSLKNYNNPKNGIRMMEVKIDVSRSDVEEYFSLQGFGCRCHALSSIGEINSTRAVVRTAYLRKYFHNHPMNNKVAVNSQVALSCLPPDGVPAPEVFWLKDGKPLDTKKDTNLIISSEGSLIISQTRLTDMGNYTCGAQNIASRRLSSTASLVIYVIGEWGSWGPWSACDSECGPGVKMRSRQCYDIAASSRRQPVVTQCEGEDYKTIECHTRCRSVISRWTPWSAWTACGPDCQRQKRRTCSSPKQKSGRNQCIGRFVITENCSGGMCGVSINGHWTSWSSWSTCGPDCQHYKKRTCTNPSPMNGGKHCFGRHLVSRNCTAGMCRGSSKIQALDGKGSNVLSEADDGPNLVLYMGIFCAIIVFVVILIIVVVIVVRKKGGDQTIYTLPLSEMRRFYSNVNPEMHLDDAHVISSDMNCNEKEQSGRKDCPSPLYSVPYESIDLSHHTINSPLIQNASSASKEKVQIPESATSEDCSTTSTHYDYDSDSGVGLSRNSSPQLFSKSKGMDKNGGKIHLVSTGVCLTVPQNAICKSNCKLTLAVLTSNHYRPNLSASETLLSPVIEIGPKDACLDKPVILSIPHCADMIDGKWKFSIYQDANDYDDSPCWEKICDVGEETINTPVYCQIDTKCCYLMTEGIARLALVGQSPKMARAVKKLKILVFAPLVQSSLDYSIRVYCIQDTPAAVQNVLGQEKTSKGKLVARISTVKLVDNLAPLCISLTSLNSGWKIKPSAVYQEIPFCHVWSGSQHNLHCSFSMEQCDSGNNRLECKLLVHQRDDNFSAIQVDVFTDVDQDMHIYKEIEPAYPYIIPNQIDTITSNHKENLKLSNLIKKQLCHDLDQPNAKGTDWRLLAKHLEVDRYITYFATKRSPTDHILDLWEARNTDESAISDLANMLRLMGRFDLVQHLEAFQNNTYQNSAPIIANS